MFANPKKEFTVNFSIDKVREAALKLHLAESSKYSLVKDDSILNQIRLHQKGVLLDPGYHIDFDLTKISDNETKVVIEVSRNMGSINNATEVTISNNSLKNAASKFSSYLSGDINPETGKANMPQQGCMVFLLLLGTATIGCIGLLFFTI
jgi:hypothetical protein